MALMVTTGSTSTPEFGFYKRTSGSWTKLANLRTPPGNVGGKMTPGAGGGAGGGPGGGGGELQNTRTLPLVNPTSFRKSIPAALPEPGTLLSQEDANKYLIKAVQNAMVTVGELPPEFPTDGQLWWCSAGDSLTLYIYLQDFNDDTQSVWTVASPPVSLEGIENSITGIEGDLIELHNNVRQVKGDIVLTNQDLQTLAQDQTRQDDAITTNSRDITQLRSRVGDVEAGQIKQDERLDALEAQDQDGGDYVEKTGVNKITGEWRIKAGGRTLLKGDEATEKLGVFNLQEPSEDHHAISRGWAKGNTVLNKGTTVVEDGWKIQDASKSHFHVEGGKTKIYWLQDPQHEEHPVTLKYADEHYAPKNAPTVEHVDISCNKEVEAVTTKTFSSGQFCGFYEGSPGDGSLAPNTYFGNWNHSVKVHIDDLKVTGKLPSSGATDSKHRGTFEVIRSSGERVLYKAVMKSFGRRDEYITFNVEHKLFATGSTSGESSLKFHFYSLL